MGAEIPVELAYASSVGTKGRDSVIKDGGQICDSVKIGEGNYKANESVIGVGEDHNRGESRLTTGSRRGAEDDAGSRRLCTGLRSVDEERIDAHENEDVGGDTGITSGVQFYFRDLSGPDYSASWCIEVVGDIWVVEGCCGF